MSRRITVAFFVVTSLLFYGVLAVEEIHENVVRNQEIGSNLPRKWISQLFHAAETDFRMNSTNLSVGCRMDFDLYLQHLNNQSIWAIRMMESSEWPSVGIFAGMVDHLGNYDECLGVSMYGIKGQYCLVQVKYDYTEDLLADKIEDVPNEGLSAWDAIKMYERNPVRVDRKKLKFALCIPSSCSTTDLENSMNNTLYPLFANNGINVSVQAEPQFCKIRSEHGYSREHYIVRWFFIVLFFVVISSTYYDSALRKTSKNLRGKSNNIISGTCEYLSITRNFQNLKKTDSGTDIPVIHFVKVVFIVLVIYTHRLLYYLGYPKFNTEAVEKLYKPISPEYVIFTHINALDVFFWISGFLKFHFGLASMMKKGSLYYVFVIVLLRWIRMVPAFCIVMLYVMYILPYTGEGPLWDHRITKEVTRCKESWSANFLAISNVVKTDQQCIIISWYISVDIQLTIIGSILLLIYAKNEKTGIIMSVVTLISCTVITFTVAYWNRYNGILRFFIKFMEEPMNEMEFTSLYIATYARAIPYMIGFMTGFIVKILNEKKFKFSTGQAIVLLFLSILIGEGCQQYSSQFFVFNKGYNRFENALYAAIHRPLFILPFAVELVLQMTSRLGIFSHKFFQLEVYVPLGRLSYGAFLVNIVIQLFHASSQKQIMPTSGSMNGIWWAIGDVVWSFSIGLIVHLFVEAPISNFAKLFGKLLLEHNKPQIEGTLEKNIRSIVANELEKSVDTPELIVVAEAKCKSIE